MSVDPRALDEPVSMAEAAGRRAAGISHAVMSLVLGAIVVRGGGLPAASLGPVLVFVVQLNVPIALLTPWRGQRPKLWQKLLALAVAVSAGGVGIAAGYTPTIAAGAIPATVLALLNRRNKGETTPKLAALFATSLAIVFLPALLDTGVTFFEHEAANPLAAGADDLGGVVTAVALIHAMFSLLTREVEAQERANAAVTEERARIACELHDVIAHQVTLGLVQAEVARASLPGGAETSAQALDRVTESSRKAMTELRSLLGVLRDPVTGQERAPQPGVSDIAALVAGSSPAGLDVTVDVDAAAADLPEGMQASIYRIVQEALTNVVRHVGPTSVAVAVRCGPDVQVSIVDAGPTGGRRPTHTAGGGGHGISGMRERVTSLGGELVAGPDGDGFAVRAALPHGAT